MHVRTSHVRDDTTCQDSAYTHVCTYGYLYAARLCRPTCVRTLRKHGERCGIRGCLRSFDRKRLGLPPAFSSDALASGLRDCLFCWRKSLECSRVSSLRFSTEETSAPSAFFAFIVHTFHPSVEWPAALHWVARPHVHRQRGLPDLLAALRQRS